MVLTYKTGASGDLAEYYRGSKQVPEMAAKLASYLGDAYALNVTAGTAALPAMDMHPLIADLLKIDTTRSLTQEEVEHLLSGLRADGKPIPGREKARPSTKDRTSLTFTDFTFSAPKHLSLAIALAPTEKEKIVLETAFMRANNALMKHIESEIGGARQGDAGSKGVIPGHMAVVQFHHHVARPTKRDAAGNDTKLGRDTGPLRPGDMSRHIHNLFMHVTITDQGDVKAPDLNTTDGQIHTWGGIGHAFLARELNAAGVRAEIDPKTHLSYLPDIPEAMVDLFSARTRQGEAVARAKAAMEGRDFDSLSRREQAERKHRAVKVGREHKEDLSEQEFWQQTAADAGYVHKSVINPENRQGLRPEAERARISYQAALTLLEPQLEKVSKLDGPTIRTAAARSMIAGGIERPDEIENVISALMTEGVRQRGQMVALIAGREHGDRFTSATTALHVSEEREAIGILKSASEDHSAKLSADQITAAVQRMTAAKGYNFSNEHGQKQVEMASALSTSRANIAIGAAGAGKSALLSVVIDGYHQEGWQSYGVTLAWRQTHGLKDAGVGRKQRRYEPDTSTLIDAGINADRAMAMAPFLKDIEAGRITLNDKTLIVIDEISTIDTQQILQLARAQREYGFKIAGVGDPAQCGAISAGNTVALFRRAVGSEQIPELLDTIRQQRIEDRVTAKMWRDNRADLALPRKESAGLLVLVPGDYADSIKAGVDWLEQRQANNAGREKYSAGVSVPTNGDVMAFGLEYRARQRAAGKLKGDDWIVGAIDQAGNQFDLPIAAGDKIRLFKRVNASYSGGKHGYFGDNGTVAEVVNIDEKYGLRLRRADGKVGAITWKTLQDKDTGRIKISYGSALTIDARQSDTLTDHLTLLADGSTAIDKHKIYSADTRGQEDNVLIISHGAEKEEVRNRRPLGDPWLAQASDEEMRQAIIDNAARNLSRDKEKVLGVEFLDRGLDITHGGVNTQQAMWFRTPQDKAKSQAERPQHEATAATVTTFQTAIAHSQIKRLTGPEDVRQQKRSMRRAAERPKPRPVRATQTEAVAEFADALRSSGFRLKGEPIMDGKWHRVQVDGDRTAKKSGRYRGYLDGRPAGFIENYKTGQASRWRSERPVPVMTAEQHRQREVERNTREVERRQSIANAEIRAASIWSQAKPVERHAYLDRKAVAAHGLRQDDRGNLLVPMQSSDGVVRNVQTITPTGDKLFQKDATKTGLYAVVGDINPTQPLLIAEGYATAATLHEATKLPVVVAFDAGNLHAVAQTIRAQYPSTQMVFAADNDHHLPRRDNPLPNIGKEKAEIAAASVGGIVLVPAFTEKDAGTDWNDFAATHGKAAVAAQFNAKGITVEKKPNEPTITQAQRDAARAASRTTQQTESQQASARQQLQQQESLRKSEGHTL